MTTLAGLGVLLTYVIVLAVIGLYGARVAKGTGEDYFLARRGLNGIAVFMALFASNITAFTIMAHAGISYQTGYGAYGYVIGWSIFATPFTYYLVGYRAWLLGKRYGYATQPQVFGGILQSRMVSLLFLVLLLYYTLPYMVLSIVGGSLALVTVSEGFVPYALAAAFIIGISLLYTLPAGMRGTVWTDIFQGFLFIGLALLLFFAVARALGGAREVTEEIIVANPALLRRTAVEQFAPLNWFSFSFVNSIAVVVFPQIFTRIMAAGSSRALKQAVVFYPPVLALVFGITTLLGIWGSVAIPGLTPTESESIVPLMIHHFLPPFWTVLGLLVVLAIVKSSIDSQLLSVSHLVTEDLLPVLGRISTSQAVTLGRLLLLLFAALAYTIALLRPAAILSIASFAFSGFSVMLPVMIWVLYWPRANKYGAATALVLPALLLHLWHLGLLPAWTTFGLMPVVPAFFLAVIILPAISLVTPSPPRDQREKIFSFFDSVYNEGN